MSVSNLKIKQLNTPYTKCVQFTCLNLVVAYDVPQNYIAVSDMYTICTTAHKLALMYIKCQWLHYISVLHLTIKYVAKYCTPNKCTIILF